MRSERRPLEKLVIATGNAGKFQEIVDALGHSVFECIAQADLGVGDVEESASTFVENALLKARHAARATGLPALADDSGLLVDALDGAPGLRSARYAGVHGDANANNARLLEALREVPAPHRSARFYCVLVLLRGPEDPQPMICEGSWSGTILHEPRGLGGFGYDPLFFDAALNASAAQLDSATKLRVGHRGQALEQLRARASAWAGGSELSQWPS